MNWQEVIDHPSLQNLPFKIELNERGQVVMSPTKILHSVYQGKLSNLLFLLHTGGEVLVECAVKTRKGIKVADVAWASSELFQQIKNDVAASHAPEICIEVFSGSNTKAEMEEKRQLYFEQGAQEVWFCNRKGAISFYNPAGKLPQSELCPEFPTKIQV
ncbi:MAG TPA: Uma2 family endonuclease [Blastocatellia bacterium]|nr:Uma2 family endonuclease [Blastocatellia bacterium]